MELTCELHAVQPILSQYELLDLYSFLNNIDKMNIISLIKTQ